MICYDPLEYTARLNIPRTEQIPVQTPLNRYTAINTLFLLDRVNMNYSFKVQLAVDLAAELITNPN